MIEMKKAIVKVPFFMNKTNMPRLLHGRVIKNFDEARSMIFNSGNSVYLPRSFAEVSEYPSIKDIVVATAIRYISETDQLELELKDSLYFHKLRKPCIKINGYMELDEAGYIIITKVTRLTLAEGYNEEKG